MSVPMRKLVLTGFVVPVLPSVAAAVAGDLFPRAVPALADRVDPRTRVSVPLESGHEKTLPAPGSEGSVASDR